MKMSIEEKRKVIREAQIIARNLASVNVWAREYGQKNSYFLITPLLEIIDEYEGSVLLNEFETDKLLKEVRDRLPAAPAPVPQYVWLLAADDAGEIGQPHMAFKTRRAALERIKRDSWCFAESRVRFVKSTRWQMSWRMSWAATNLAGNFVERAAWLLKMEVSDE